MSTGSLAASGSGSGKGSGGDPPADESCEPIVDLRCSLSPLRGSSCQSPELLAGRARSLQPTDPYHGFVHSAEELPARCLAGWSRFVTACASVNGLGVSLVCLSLVCVSLFRDCLYLSHCLRFSLFKRLTALSVSVWIHNEQSISHFVSPHAKPQIVPLECSRPTDCPPCAFKPACVSSRSHTDDLEEKLEQGQRTCNEVAGTP